MHAMRCITALLTCQFQYIITNVAIDNGYLWLSTNHGAFQTKTILTTNNYNN